MSQFLRLKDSFSFHFLVAVTHCFIVQEEGPNLSSKVLFEFLSKVRPLQDGPLPVTGRGPSLQL